MQIKSPVRIKTDTIINVDGKDYKVVSNTPNRQFVIDLVEV